ncbi:1525_t:CDS:1, partial [Paraglomus occultum]
GNIVIDENGGSILVSRTDKVVVPSSRLQIIQIWLSSVYGPGKI